MPNRTLHLQLQLYAGDYYTQQLTTAYNFTIQLVTGGPPPPPPVIPPDQIPIAIGLVAIAILSVVGISLVRAGRSQPSSSDDSD